MKSSTSYSVPIQLNLFGTIQIKKDKAIILLPDLSKVVLEIEAEL